MKHQVKFLLLCVMLLLNRQVFAASAEELVTEKHCLDCHDITATRIGPSFHDISHRFNGLNNAKTMLSHIIQAGSDTAGAYHWGPNKMPSDSARTPVSQEEANKLVDYILSIK